MSAFDKILHDYSTSEIYYHQLFSKSSLGIGIFTLNSEIIEANAALLKIFNANNLEEAKTIPLGDYFLNPHTRESVRQEILDTGFIKERVVAFKTLKNHTVNLLINGNVIESEGQQLLLISALDVSNQKQIEGKLKILNDKLLQDALRRSKLLTIEEKKYKALFETSRDAIIVYNGKTIADCNQSTLKLFGFSHKNEIIGLEVSDISPELQYDDEPTKIRAERYTKRALSGKLTHFGWLHKKQDSSIIECEVTVSLVSKDPLIFHVLVRDISKHLAIKREMEENEEKYRALFESSRDAVMLLYNNRVIDCNHASERLLGYSQKELIGMHPAEFSPENQPGGNDTVVSSNYFIKQALETNTSVFQWTHLKKNGTPVPCEVTLSRVVYHGKKAIHAIVRDISQHFAAQKAIQESELKYRTLLNNIPLKVFYKDKNSVYMAVNKQFAQEINIDPKEIIGRTDIDFFPEHIAKKHIALDREVMNTGKTMDVEEHISINNIPRVIETIKTPVYNSLGELQGVLGMHWDITEKAQLKQQRDMMFKYSVDMLCIANFDGYFKFLNPAWNKVLGWSNAELLENPWLHYVHPDDLDRTIEATKKLANGEVLLFFENRYQCKNGNYKWISWNSAPFTDQKLIFAVARDITEKKRDRQKLIDSEQQLRTINAQKDRFFSIVSHDLRSPLASLCQLAELLHSEFDEFTPEEQKHYLQVIQETSRNTMDLTEDLLTWAKSQMGKLNLDPELIHLHDLSEEVLKPLLNSAKKKEVVLENKIGTHVLCFAHLNSVKLILRNLLSNAIKYTRKGDKVSITVKNINKEMAQVSVVDTGTGIPRDRLVKLFKITEVVSTRGTNNEKGTGLGLLLCKELVEKNGGKIWVSSNVNEGSIFSFTLPLK
jgi:PAS domain S-box-containing protein